LEIPITAIRAGSGRFFPLPGTAHIIARTEPICLRASMTFVATAVRLRVSIWCQRNHVRDDHRNVDEVSFAVDCVDYSF
jgi:hypothetical protein